MSTTFNRRDLIFPLLNSTTTIRSTSTITICRVNRTIKSRSSHLLPHRLTSNHRSIIFALNIRIKNNFIRRMSKQIIRRHANRNRALTLPTKRIQTTLVRQHIRPLLTTTRYNRIRLFRYNPRYNVINDKHYRPRVKASHSLRSNHVIQRSHRNTRTTLFPRHLRQRATRHRTTHMPNTNAKRGNHGNTFATTKLTRRQSRTTLQSTRQSVIRSNTIVFMTGNRIIRLRNNVLPYLLYTINELIHHRRTRSLLYQNYSIRHSIRMTTRRTRQRRRVYHRRGSNRHHHRNSLPFNGHHRHTSSTRPHATMNRRIRRNSKIRLRNRRFRHSLPRTLNLPIRLLVLPTINLMSLRNNRTLSIFRGTITRNNMFTPMFIRRLFNRFLRYRSKR